MPNDTKGTNGSGAHHLGDDDETPTERPLPLLPEHRRYVQVLGDVIPPLHAVVMTLGEILHELRIARQPMGQSTLSKVAEAGAVIESIGASIKTGFGFGG